MRGETFFPTAHEDIAESCIIYLRMKQFMDHEAIHLKNDPLLTYAALHWGHHVRHANSDRAFDLALQLLHDEKARLTAAQLLVDRSSSTFWKQRVGLKSAASTKALHLAAYFGLSRLIEGLGLMKEINDGGDRTGSPVYWAMEGNQNETLKTLLEHGADANAPRFQAYADARYEDSGYDTYPLIDATKMGNIEAITLLLQHGAVVNQSQSGKYGAATALTNAVRACNENAVNLLLANGARVNFDERIVPWTSRYGTVSIMKKLIDGGASSASINNALEIARLSGSKNSKEMEALLEQCIVDSES